MLRSDIYTLLVIGAIIIAAVALLWKELKLLSFDQEFATASGLPVRLLEAGLTLLIVLSIVVGLQMAGVVLMSALLVAPAAAARQWTNRLAYMAGLAMFFGALSGTVGALLSASAARVPTGPAIVLAAGLAVILSLLFAPLRGLVWAGLRHQRQHRRIQLTAVLTGLYRLSAEHTGHDRAHSAASLDAVGLHAASRTLPLLARRGLVQRADGLWQLTAEGIAAAERDEQARSAAGPDSGSSRRPVGGTP